MRQRASRMRVGPATSVTGAETIWDAVRCAPVSEATVTVGASIRTGSADRRPGEGCERSDDQLPGGDPVEHVTGRSGGDRDVQAAADESCLLVVRVDRVAEEAELVGERRLVGADRRRRGPPGRTAARVAGSRGRSRTRRPGALPPRPPRASRPRRRAARGVIAKRCIPKTKVTGTPARRFERASRSRCACAALSPPTSIARDVRALRQLVGRSGEDQSEADRNRRRQRSEERQARPEARTRGWAGCANCGGRHEGRMVAAAL